MNTKQELLDIASQIATLARELGAEEATVSVGAGASTELSRRDGRVEKAQESRSRSASVELLVDGRFSTHGTNDLRPEALREFLGRAVAGTRLLEPDPHRRLPPAEELGESTVDLDLDDPSWAEQDPEARRTWVESLEATTRAELANDPVRSLTTYVYDSRSVGVSVWSNGHSAANARTSFGHGAMVSLVDKDGRLPEGWASISTAHRNDLPGQERIAKDLAERARGRLGSGPIASGRYHLLLDRRAVAKVLGVALGPLSGSAIYEQRSCMADKLGTRIAAAGLNLIDEPLIPRAPGSRTSDGDGYPTRARPILQNGVLETFFIDLYNARRMEVARTTGGASNLVIPPGNNTPSQLVLGLPAVIRVEGFLGGNNNPTTGDFSFGIQGTFLENGEATRSLSEMNISGNIFELLERWVAAADDTYTYSSWRCPSLLFEDIQFSGL